MYQELIRQANSEIVMLMAKLNKLADQPQSELNLHEIRLILAQLKIVNQIFDI